MPHSELRKVIRFFFHVPGKFRLVAILVQLEDKDTGLLGTASEQRPAALRAENV